MVMTKKKQIEKSIYNTVMTHPGGETKYFTQLSWTESFIEEIKLKTLWLKLCITLIYEENHTTVNRQSFCLAASW